MGFKQGFGDKAGKNTANALFNLFGIDFSDRRRVSVDISESRKVKAQAQADLIEARAAVARKNQLNAIDKAVLDNIDKVIAVQFSNDPQELCSTLQDLTVQLEANTWHTEDDDEAKIRNKFTSAVLSKLKMGVRVLESIDPYNPQIDYFSAIIRKANRRKVWSKLWIALVFVVVFGTMGIWAVAEENPGFMPKFWLILGFVVVAIIAILVGVSIHRAKVKKNRILAYQAQKGTPQVSEAAPAPVVDVEKEEVKPAKPSVDPIAELKSRYDALWGKYSGVNEIMGRGYSAEMTISQKDILIIGFNPSFDNKPGNVLYPLPPETKGYWGSVNKMLLSATTNLRSNAEYIDLFAFRETHQPVGTKEVIQNSALFPYVVEQVSLTQEIIENTIKPKVIVIKNKEAWAFFGKMPQFTWMGYNFEHIDDTPHGELCRIRGFRPDKDRINPHIVKSSIDGAYVLFTTHTAVDTYPTPEYLAALLAR